MSDKIVPVPVKSEPDAVASGSVSSAKAGVTKKVEKKPQPDTNGIVPVPVKSEPDAVEAGVAKKVKKEPQPDSDEIFPVPVKSEPNAVEDEPISITNNLKRSPEFDTVGDGLVASAKKIKKEPESDGEEDPVEPRGTDPTLSLENDAAVKANKKIQEDWEEFKTENGIRGIKGHLSPFLSKTRDDYGRCTQLLRIPRPGSAGENVIDFICIGRMVNGNCPGEKTGTCVLFHGDNGIFCVQDVDAVSRFFCVPCAPFNDESESTSQDDEESKRLLKNLRNAWSALDINLTDRNSPYMEWKLIRTKSGGQKWVKKLMVILKEGSEQRICLIAMLTGKCTRKDCIGKHKCKGFHGTEVTIEGSTVFVFDIEDIRAVANAGRLVIDGL